MPEHRTAPDVAKRCLALLTVIQRCREEDPSPLLQWAERSEVIRYLSDAERDFVLSKEPNDKTRVNFSWRAECLITLLWSLGHLEELPGLDEEVDLADYPVVQSAADDPHAFIASAVLRPAEDLDAAEEELYNHHWEVRDAQLFGRAIPEGLDPGVVYERRYALSWLVGWGDDWDDVPTDT